MTSNAVSRPEGASRTQTAQVPQSLLYCLYARKSSEQSEKQALSIDSQISEMQAIADRDGLVIAEIHRESHSAKESNQRPVYNQMIQELCSGKFNAILTWAPDRLSRNAGDLGSIVDLMDQGKLIEIRTQGQRFTNHPNEKFLLMILCSQAKLENDNKSVNVKRGLKAKVEMGYRPNMSPLGYLHDKFAEKGARRIFIDPERGPIIKEAFHKVAYECWTGRDLKRWLDDDKGFRTRKGKKITLSMIYRMMGNHFYTGRYEFPTGSGTWFEGKHEALITKEIFDRVQETMKGNAERTHPGSKEFAFTKMFKCGSCGSTLTADEKIKRLKDGTIRRYVYYGCGKKWITGCKEPWIREEDLLDQLYGMVDKIDIHELDAVSRIKEEIARVEKMIKSFGGHAEKLLETIPKIDARACAKYILKEGTREEKRQLLGNIKCDLLMKNRILVVQ
jgi:DNA invertase Pin-like site-specific DNA recombinase